ncbi:MAG: HlyD family efflux transporter periplasmic adaptor subunit [Planctomycetota bacterium]
MNLKGIVWFGLCGLVSFPLSSVQAQDEALTAKVVKEDLAIDVELPGVFIAEDKDELAMEPAEYRGDLIVTKILPEGTSVKKGDVLMEFDADKLERALEEAEDKEIDADVEMKKAEAERKAAEIDHATALGQLQKELEIAQKKLAAATEQATLALEEKDKEIKDAKDRIKDAEVDFQQLKELYVERELHTATENILIEREERKLENMKKGLDKQLRDLEHFKKFENSEEIEAAELEIAKKQSEIDKKKIEVEAELAEKTAAVSKAQRKLERESRTVTNLKEDRGDLQLISPRDGVLFYQTTGSDMPMGVVSFGGMRNELRVGGRVKTHAILLTVATMERLSVKMQVLENDIQHMKEGLNITIRPDAFPSLRIDGQLSKVDHVASRQNFFSEVRRFTVKGDYDGVYPQLRSGMNCRVTVHADSVPDAVQVPVVAVIEEGGDHYCYVQNGSKPRKQKVKIGMANEDSVQILEGLKPNEVVYLVAPEQA